MTEELRTIQRELAKTRRYLSSLEAKYQRAAIKMRSSTEEEKRLESLKQELRREYPNMKFTPKTMKLLKTVGTLPYSPVEKDKEDIAEAIAREYS